MGINCYQGDGQGDKLLHWSRARGLNCYKGYMQGYELLLGKIEQGEILLPEK